MSSLSEPEDSGDRISTVSVNADSETAKDSVSETPKAVG